MDGEATGGEPAGRDRTRSRWQLISAAVLVFGLLAAVSGVTVASVAVTVQGTALAAAGVLGLVFSTGARPRLLPRRMPLSLPLGALVLVATAVESVRGGMPERGGLSAWAPLGLLVGVALLSVPVRALPPVERPTKEPSAAVVLVVIGLVLMIGYEGLQHLSSPDLEQLPSYLAAVGMPLVAAIGAGALAVLAATRGGVAGVAAGGALVLVSASLYLGQAARDAWWSRQQAPIGNRAAPMLVQTLSTDQHAAAVSFATYGAESAAAGALILVGLVLTVAGWWWAAVRRAAG